MRFFGEGLSSFKVIFTFSSFYNEMNSYNFFTLILQEVFFFNSNFNNIMMPIIVMDSHELALCIMLTNTLRRTRLLSLLDIELSYELQSDWNSLVLVLFSPRRLSCQKQLSTFHPYPLLARRRLPCQYLIFLLSSPNSLNDSYERYVGPTFDEPWSPDDDSSTPSLSPTSDLDLSSFELVEDGDDHVFCTSPRAESEHQPLGYIYSPPFQSYSFFDYDSSTPVPCSPSRRRSASLPELEPTTFKTDLFGLHKSIPEEPPLPDIDVDMPDIRWCSFPGCETDDDLIPMELASKNYIPDPSDIVPTSSTATRSLLLWDHDYNDRCDMPIPRSPSPENFYLDPTILEECGDEELQNVYELRQRTAKSEKWDRERCRELSALLRLKLDERGVLRGGKSGDCSSNRQNASRSFTWPQPEGPKRKIRSMAQLVASMLFHRQSDTMRRQPSRKASFERTYLPPNHSPRQSPSGGARSKLSKVIIP